MGSFGQPFFFHFPQQWGSATDPKWVLISCFQYQYFRRRWPQTLVENLCSGLRRSMWRWWLLLLDFVVSPPGGCADCRILDRQQVWGAGDISKLSFDCIWIGTVRHLFASHFRDPSVPVGLGWAHFKHHVSHRSLGFWAQCDVLGLHHAIGTRDAPLLSLHGSAISLGASLRHSLFHPSAEAPTHLEATSIGSHDWFALCDLLYLTLFHLVATTYLSHSS